jgi:hypothetical protein
MRPLARIEYLAGTVCVVDLCSVSNACGGPVATVNAEGMQTTVAAVVLHVEQRVVAATAAIAAAAIAIIIIMIMGSYPYGRIL